MQRKFTRKPKFSTERKTPIINFQDYSGAMTPLDRYRKHALMFDYWNDQLLEELGTPSSSPKRLKHASGEALTELKTLCQLLADEPAARLSPLVEERATLDAQIQSGGVAAIQVGVLRRQLESQTRQIERDFSSWRKMEDQLKP